jgi:hypothetical protein
MESHPPDEKQPSSSSPVYYYYQAGGTSELEQDLLENWAALEPCSRSGRRLRASSRRPNFFVTTQSNREAVTTQCGSAAPESTRVQRRLEKAADADRHRRLLERLARQYGCDEDLFVKAAVHKAKRSNLTAEPVTLEVEGEEVTPAQARAAIAQFLGLEQEQVVIIAPDSHLERESETNTSEMPVHVKRCGSDVLN